MKIKVKEQDATNLSAAEQRAQRTDGTAVEPAHGSIHGVQFDSVPKDYRRTDSELRDDIIDAFGSHTALAPERIDVSVDDGVAVLEGIVETPELIRVAERAARSVLDVRDVQNRIEAKHPESR